MYSILSSTHLTGKLFLGLTYLTSTLYLLLHIPWQHHRPSIAITTSTMSELSSLWTSSRLSLALKMRLYNSLISAQDNNPQTTSKCLRTHSAVCNPALKPSTFWPPPHLHHGAAQEDIHHSAGLTKSSKTPRSP